MRNTRNLVRFLALVAALAMLVAVSLAVSPLMACVWALCFLAICSMGIYRGEVAMTSSGSDGLSPSEDAPSFAGNRPMRQVQRRRWAREYPVGFRSLCSAAKNVGAAEPNTAVQFSTMRPAGGPLGRGPAISRKAQCNLIAFNANDQCFGSFLAA